MFTINRLTLVVSSFSFVWSFVHSAELNLRRKRFNLHDTTYNTNNNPFPLPGGINTENNEVISQNRRTLEDIRSTGQRKLLNEYGAVPLHQEHLNSIVLEDIVSMMESLDLSMSYIATPTSSPTRSTQSPSINCASPTARELNIREYADSVSSTTANTDPSTPQYEAIQWMLNTDLNTNACDGFTSISQRFGLAMLYFSTNGSLWTNSDGWLSTSVSECDWRGVICNQNGSFIEAISLPVNKVSGSIPDEFFFTTPSLINVSFFGNAITGTLPVSIGSLTQLSILDLENNRLTGPLFTPGLFKLTNTLNKLWVSFNEFEDEIPPTISQFSLLENLWAAENKLQGTLPTELGMLNSLTKLLIYNNQLSGAIPSELANVNSTLLWIDIRNCSLTGTIPEEIYELTKLERLVLNNNALTGSVSSKLSSLIDIQQLFLHDNLFNGLLPDLTGLDKMINLDINNNTFSGVLPDVSQWSNLESIDVSNNELEGGISPGFFENKLMLDLAYFSNNSFVGPIPPNYFSPPKLRDLYFDGNNLTGKIPSPSLDGLESIEELLFHRNDLTGLMPGDLCTIRTSNNVTFLNLFADCLPDPNNGNSIQISCPIGCCNKCYT